MEIIAINKSHQTKVNRAIYWLKKYNELNTQRDTASDYDESALYKKLDRQCAASFDKYLDIVCELPKRERERIEKSELY
jgi:hypothetical protein